MRKPVVYPEGVVPGIFPEFNRPCYGRHERSGDLDYGAVCTLHNSIVTVGPRGDAVEVHWFAFGEKPVNVLE